jgi:hypothetical protein
MKAAPASDPEALAPQLAETVERHRTDAGVLRLRGPEFRRRHLHRLVAWMVRAPPRVEVELDDIGTFVVERMDGQRSLRELADELAAHLKLSRREAEAALAQFVSALMRRGLARLAPRPEPRT